MADGKVSAKAIVAGALSGVGAIGTFKLIESLTKKVEAGEPIMLDPETLALLATMAAGIEESSRGVAASAAGINALLAAGGMPAPTLKIVQIAYSRTLAIAGTAGSGARLVEYAPNNGYMKWIMMHYPPGTSALVDIAVGHGVTQLSPREGYLALDDTTQIFYFNEYVEDHEEIWVEMRNGDGSNPHTITVTVGFETEV